MKKISFLLAVLATVWCGRAFADFIPENSKGGKVTWYFLECLATDSRAGAIYTVVDNEVYGLEKADYSDPDKLARQLWCFESEDGENWVITSRYDGRKLGVGLGHKGEALFMRDQKQATFQIKQDDVVDGIKLWSNIAAPGGGDKYRTPCVEGEKEDNVIWLISNENPASHQASFKCVKYDDSYEADVEEGQYAWFNIASADKDGNNEILVDNTSAVDALYSFTLEQKESKDFAAQWRLDESVPGKVAIINRATGNSISNSLIAVDRYNVPTAGAADASANVWQLRPVSEDQYTISAPGSIDNVRRWFTAQSVGAAANAYIDNAGANTSYAWKFVDPEIGVAINDATAESAQVTVQNGKIIAPAGAKVIVTTTDGIKLDAASRLAPGIYLVTVNGKTTKILVH